MTDFHMLTTAQKTNLRILRDFVSRQSPEQFDMGTYCESGRGSYTRLLGLDDAVENDHTCNTSMCLIGWSAVVPEFEVTVFESVEHSESWSTLASRLYGTSDISDITGEYLFSSQWDYQDHTATIEHAVGRINAILEAETEEDYGEVFANSEINLG